MFIFLSNYTSVFFKSCSLYLLSVHLFAECIIWINTINLLNGLNWLQNQLESEEPLASKADFIIHSSDALKASVRIHLFTLLCEEMKVACAKQLEENELIFKLIRLLGCGQQVLASRSKSCEASDKLGDSLTPKWYSFIYENIEWRVVA